MQTLPDLFPGFARIHAACEDYRAGAGYDLAEENPDETASAILDFLTGSRPDVIV